MLAAGSREIKETVSACVDELANERTGVGGVFGAFAALASVGSNGTMQRRQAGSLFLARLARLTRLTERKIRLGSVTSQKASQKVLDENVGRERDEKG